MTRPADNLPHPEWWPKSSGCTALDCDRQPETVDGVNGRRCHAHPPAYSPHYLRALMAARRYATARAYIRTMVAWGQETGR